MTDKRKIHDRIGIGNMNSKKGLKNSIIELENQISTIKNAQKKEQELLAEKEKSDETGSGLLSLLKYIVNENKKTTLLLEGISRSLARLEDGLHDQYYEDEAASPEEGVATRAAKEVPVSSLDAEIIKCIQIKGMACADDIKKAMNYKGRNAASMHLNRLYKMGIIERYQLGRKVYYKYDAGKAADTLIVSPPQ